MQYRAIEKTGDRLSILGFGCMRLPQKKGKIDEERAAKQILYSIDNGVNYLDTGFSYHHGKSEPFLGRVLPGGYREKVNLATKLPHWSTHSKKDMDKILDEQLSKLKTDRIDYYLVHGLVGESWEKAKQNGVIDFLDDALKNGKIINQTKGESYEFTPLPDFALEIIDRGGLLNTLAKK